MINEITEQIIPYKRKTFKITHILCRNIYLSRPYIFKILDVHIQTQIQHFKNIGPARINIITKSMSNFKGFSYIYI